MRPIHYILDLPWWVGLAIFLCGNWIVPHYYIIGAPVTLFGAWTFSKLLSYEEIDGAVGYAVVGFPLFFLAMLVPASFTLETPVLDLLNGLSPKVTYAIRAALGIFTSLIAFIGVRR